MKNGIYMGHPSPVEINAAALNIPREVATQRGLKKLATSERFNDVELSLVQHELNSAFDAGHIEGSGVKHQTEAEIDLCAAIRDLTEYEVYTIGLHVSEGVAELMRGIRSDLTPLDIPVTIDGASLDD